MTNEMQTQARAATGSKQVQGAPYIVPPVDVFEDEVAITLLADLPGVSRDRLAVRIDGDNMVIEGWAQVPASEDLELVHGEAPVPAYRREFTLSRELDASRIEAGLKDGVLSLRIPKAEHARPRRIEVKVSE
ncbi:MAG: putative heat shock protein [Ramlibacter sp.]|nr:putative heat shock protein [Ramlibacter sp.]